jgi:hypothetical protein
MEVCAFDALWSLSAGVSPLPAGCTHVPCGQAGAISDAAVQSLLLTLQTVCHIHTLRTWLFL